MEVEKFTSSEYFRGCIDVLVFIVGYLLNYFRYKFKRYKFKQESLNKLESDNTISIKEINNKINEMDDEIDNHSELLKKHSEMIIRLEETTKDTRIVVNKLCDKIDSFIDKQILINETLIKLQTEHNMINRNCQKDNIINAKN